MDMHIHMSYLTFTSFQILASNYLEMKDDDNHPLLEEIKRMIEIEMVNATRSASRKNSVRLAPVGARRCRSLAMS